MSEPEPQRAEKLAIAALLIGVVFVLAGLRHPLTLLTGFGVATSGALLASSGEAGVSRQTRLVVSLLLFVAILCGIGAMALDFGESWHASQLLERGASLELMRAELRTIANWRRMAQIVGLVAAAAMAGIALTEFLRQRRKIAPTIGPK
ncbi:MAG: hypothetical protein QM813_22220 [Verrucomicrobiota bacterium]